MAFRIAAVRVVKTPITIAPDGVTVGDPVCETNPDCPAVCDPGELRWYCAQYVGEPALPVGPYELSDGDFANDWLVYDGPFDTEEEVECPELEPVNTCGFEAMSPVWRADMAGWANATFCTAGCGILNQLHTLAWDTGNLAYYSAFLRAPTCEGGDATPRLELTCNPEYEDPEDPMTPIVGGVWVLNVAYLDGSLGTFEANILTWNPTGPNVMTLASGPFGCGGSPTVTVYPVAV